MPQPLGGSSEPSRFPAEKQPRQKTQQKLQNMPKSVHQRSKAAAVIAAAFSFEPAFRPAVPA
jgi:hypothetical protein